MKDILKFNVIIIILGLTIFMLVIAKQRDNYKTDYDIAIIVIGKGGMYIDSINQVTRKYRKGILTQIVYDESGVTIPYYVTTREIDSILMYGEQYKIPIRLHFRLLEYESKFRRDRVSSAGAVDMYQIMPSNINPNMSIFENGCSIFRHFRDISNSWEEAVARYNGTYPNINTNMVKYVCN